MIALAAAALQLIAFETLDGREVLINPANIVSVSETSEVRKPQEKLLTEKVHCVINMTNGKFISVAEACDSVRRRLEALK
jgi:uncharacterized protein YlzI (FlbEa/FlbD family)